MRQGLEAHYQGNKYDKYYWTVVFVFDLLASFLIYIFTLQ